MTKEDRAKLFSDQCEMTEEPERVEGETIPQSEVIPGLPVDIRERIENAIYDYCNYECKPPIEDLSKARAPRWSACCMYIGEKVTKKLFKVERGEGGRWKPYNDEILSALIPLWLYYCATYDKAPLKGDFSYFAGVGFDLIYVADPERLSPTRADVLQKLIKIQENGLSALISDGSRNPTGALAILNHWHGWSQHNVNVTVNTQKALSAASLPALGTNAETEPLPTLTEINNSNAPVETV